MNLLLGKRSIPLLLLVSLLSAVACRQAVTGQSVDESGLVIADHASNQHVKAFGEDQYGQVWIGTFRGLNKYDGTKFHQHFCMDDTSGLPESNITSIHRDRRNRLWIATASGVAIYDGKNGFSRVNMPLRNKNVNKFLEDSRGHVFFFNGFEIYQYDERRNTVVKRIDNLDPYTTFSDDAMMDDRGIIWVRTPQQLRGFRVRDFKEVFTLDLRRDFPTFSEMKDSSHIWLHGLGGLRLFNTHTRRFVPLPKGLSQLPVVNGDVRCIHVYDANRLLIATERKGLLLYDFRSDKMLTERDNAFPFSTDGICVNTMFTDSRGNLWMGSDDQGFRVIYKYKDMFNAHESMSRAVGRQSVKSIAADQDDNVWMVTKHHGLCCYDRRTQQLLQMVINSTQLDFDKNAATHVFIDREGYVWVSNTFGVVKCNHVGGVLRVMATYKIFLPMDFAQDVYGNVWVTTAGIYVYRIQSTTGTMEQKQLYPKAFVFIPSIIPLQSRKMLVSAFAQPLMEIDARSMESRQFDVDAQQFKACIRQNEFIPTKVVQDKNNDLWLGTVSNGLLYYNMKQRRMERISGLSCADVSSIEMDRKGNLWVSTMNGLDKLNPRTRQVTCYNEADGIGGFQFYDRSSCHLKDGTLVFGGTHGITAFNPERVNTDKHVRLMFQHLTIHNQLVMPGAEAPITESMETASQIRLGYRQNSFSISFSAIDYSDYKRIHYFYKMEGLDNQWTDAGNNTAAYYSNLPAGCYNFRVKILANDSNQTIAERSIRIHIAPMPWNSWWARLLYVCLALGVAYAVIRFRNRIAEEKRSARRAEEEREQEQRINRMNMSFFANVSHEFRTPLTMIAGPVEQLADSKSVSPHDRQLLGIIDRSVKRMLRLVNQLLDFNKLENDTLRLRISRMDIIAEMRRIMDLFLMNADEKGVSIACHGLEGSFLMWLDADKLEKIINNLMSNAMKFTPRGGRIDLVFDVETSAQARQNVRIIVADTGKGLPKNELENVFKRYYQLDNQLKGTINWGSGIGLYYARALAQLHHGRLVAGNRQDATYRDVLGFEDVNSTGSGAVFTLTLPVNDDVYAADERVKTETDQTTAYPLTVTAKTPADKTADDVEEECARPTILVVDDDTEVVHYLRTLLSPQYRVLYRFDAESALKAAREEEPHLILSDVVMPGISGYELCSEVKHDIRLSHIPVVLVTAKIAAEDQVAGLEHGADAYVSKPFTPKVLLAIISSQLLNREKVKAILANATETDQVAKEMLSPQDRQFMDELYKVMEQELSSSELEVNRVSGLMLMSRTKLYYKVKGLTGETPSVFFKTFKINRAAALIAEGKYNISEIAFMTGFNTLSHFSTSFKKQFGCSPSDYARRKY